MIQIRIFKNSHDILTDMFGWTIEAIVWLLMMVDAVIFVWVSFANNSITEKLLTHYKNVIPRSKLYAALYFGLLLWIGTLLRRLGQF